jgi:hypothetical protein
VRQVIEHDLDDLHARTGQHQDVCRIQGNVRIANGCYIRILPASALPRQTVYIVSTCHARDLPLFMGGVLVGSLFVPARSDFLLPVLVSLIQRVNVLAWEPAARAGDHSSQLARLAGAACASHVRDASCRTLVAIQKTS